MNDSFERHRPSFSLSTERVFFISSTENALVVVVWRGGCNHVAQIKGSRLLCGAVGGRIKWCQPTTSVQVFQVQLYCGSTHQSPGGKNRPEILKFQDGEYERLKRRVSGCVRAQKVRKAYPALLSSSPSSSSPYPPP